jgi:GWxTD domain-containing protein
MNRIFNRKTIVFIIAGFLFGLSLVWADTRPEQFREPPIGIPRFHADYAVFKSLESAAAGRPGKLKVELYAKIPLRSLYAVKEEGREMSSYELAMIVRDKSGKQITGISRQNKLENPGKDKFTTETPSFILESRAFVLDRDKYLIEFLLTDLVSELQAQNTIDIDLTSYKNPLILSGIELTLGEEKSEQIVKEDFTKHGMLVIPAVMKSFDSQRDLPGYYCEIYPTRNLPDIVQVVVNIKPKNGDENQYSDTTAVVVKDRSRGVIPVFSKFDISKMIPGGYELYLELYDSDYRNKLAAREVRFAIDWSLKTLIENNFKLAVNQLRYIATPEERDELMKVNEDQRVEAVSAFWKKHDPTPATPQNELREEYYSRLRFANQNYSKFGRPGYLTDFGRVYITYGKPDHVERHPFDQDSKPYEIWYYYRFHRKFIFVDKTGYGNYELLYPYADGIKM